MLQSHERDNSPRSWYLATAVGGTVMTAAALFPNEVANFVIPSSGDYHRSQVQIVPHSVDVYANQLIAVSHIEVPFEK